MPLRWATFAWMLVDLVLNRFGMSVFLAAGVWTRILTEAPSAYITVRSATAPCQGMQFCER